MIYLNTFLHLGKYFDYALRREFARSIRGETAPKNDFTFSSMVQNSDMNKVLQDIERQRKLT